MVSKSNLAISFLVLVTFWLVGRIFHNVFSLNSGLVTVIPVTIAGLLLYGLVAFFFSSLFFGRIGFLFFFILGVVDSSPVSYETILLNAVVGIVLGLFGCLGIFIGEMVSRELQNEEDIVLFRKKLGAVALIALILTLAIPSFVPNVNSYNEKAIDTLRDFRDKKIDLLTVVFTLMGVQAMIPVPPDSTN